ncbi:DNA -binding domain-containing protein [Rhodopseudomonas sp. NSM]|uniref:DNA -binding domain-containing protein n=1 Tax=Rhodopseudomonas sp. NSM TaxID=3457630 RepID=UPI004035E02E
MRLRPELDPDVDGEAPTDDRVTPYDQLHLITYLRLLDAEAEGADWREVARIVLHLDPDRYPAASRRSFESHLARARWMTSVGYRHLLRP